ncbi:MAG: phosphate ABC transporter substrate-binding protein [Pelagibacterales bacterium]|nr:phosphate ABC transporter substrate-binding protein [Pelagibacterales bacterium]
MLRFLVIIFLATFPNWSFASSAKESQKSSSRNYLTIVGSSTVYPFAATIAEEFGRNAKSKNPKSRTPIVEAMGTGGGFKLFCSGVGVHYPDFSNASRRIEKSEIARCLENGISEPVEIKIGYDGIVLANSLGGLQYNLTKEQIFLALAENVPDASGEKLVPNPYQKWSDIDAKLPNIAIAIYGPPSTSGTRDAFVELVMEEPCVKLKVFEKEYSDKKKRQKKCHVIRSDGKFIEAGENDNLIVQKLRNDVNALGIFGFSFLEENHEIIQASRINDVEPSFDNIVLGTYPVSRPLFIYFKKEHLNLIPQMREFISEIISTDTVGKDGYLLQKGLIPLTDLEIQKVKDEVKKSF